MRVQQEQCDRKRSINLALSERGIAALRRVDLLEPVLLDTIPMRARMIHNLHGEDHVQPYGDFGEVQSAWMLRSVDHQLGQ